MRLIAKLTIWYIIVTALVLAIGGNIVFDEIMHNVDNEAQVKLRSWIHNTEEQLKNGVPINELNINSSILVQELDVDDPMVEFFQKDTTGVFPPRKRGDDRKMIIGKSIKTGNKHYYIEVENFVAEPDEIQEGVESSLKVVALIIVVIVGILSIIISRIILKPFKHALDSMDAFNIKDQKALQFKKAGTKEFNSLNRFLEKMTKKAVDDYRVLKEFSENAAHEIQTPLAVIRGKLELLMQCEIDEQQANYINSIQNSVNKLSAVNNALTLLTKLENQEYFINETTDLSKVLHKTLESFSELITMKNISLETNIEKNVTVGMHPYLADVLINNLVSNSIKHNIPEGKIIIGLSKNELAISNTGEVPDVSTKELFQRFKKSNQSADSTGLGLSIAKKICDKSDLKIDYHFENSLHTVKILF